jgi:alpha-beta hydrolase superfamily lysophospholipase
MRIVSYSLCALPALAFLLLLPCSGCGMFAVDDGLYPLPAIHIVTPIPSDVGLAFEDVHLTAANGQTLYGWYIPASHQPRATVLIHHGAVANRSSTTDHYRMLNDLGCNVFIYDFQGFGENWSLATLATVLPDADLALAYVQGREQVDHLPIIIFGASLGTAATFAQASRNPAGVVAVIAEGSCVPQDLPFYTYAMIGMTPSPESYLDFPDDLNPLVTVPLVTLPKLFIHSAGDSITPIAGARLLYESAPEPKEFEEVTGEHLFALSTDPEHYRQIFSTFLDRVLGSSAP